MVAAGRTLRCFGAVAALIAASCVSCDAASAGVMAGRRGALGRAAVPRALSRTLRLRGGTGTAIPLSKAAVPAAAPKAVPLSPGGTAAVPLVKPFGRIQRTNSYSSLNEVELTGDKAGKISEDDALNTIHKLELEIEKLAAEAHPRPPPPRPPAPSPPARPVSCRNTRDAASRGEFGTSSVWSLGELQGAEGGSHPIGGGCGGNSAAGIRTGTPNFCRETEGLVCTRNHFSGRLLMS